MIKVVVFDFDGVIVPSEEIKIEGYGLMFSEFGEEVPSAAIEEARREFSDARGNRFDIIRSILTRTGKTEKLEEGVAVYAERFGKIVKERIESLRVTDGVHELLGKLSKEFPLYINSNNPDDVLRVTLQSLGVEKYFKGIYGSSKKKAENLAEIARLESASSQEMLFIGDGTGDLKAAQEFGCKFIGIAHKVNQWRTEGEGFKTIGSLEELLTQNGERLERMV